MKRKDTCRHFNGIQHKLCGAGLNIREVTGGDPIGWAMRMPCTNDDSAIECERYEEPTEQELKEGEAALEALLTQMRLVTPLCAELRAKHPEGGTGVTECPVCKGNLSYSVSSYNLHVHGRCETDDCLNWMQ